MTVSTRVEEILQAALKDMGYGIVFVHLRGAARAILEITIERLDGQPISMEDCVAVSREASVLLDVEDPIQGPYVLHVISPGLDRPLRKQEEFERFVGSLITLKTIAPKEGRRRFQGLLKACEGNTITLELTEEAEQTAGTKVEIMLEEIEKARLVPQFKIPPSPKRKHKK